MVVVSMVIVALGGYTVWRIQQSLRQSINREMRRTEAMIAGMSDGVMLVDREGKSIFLNPAGERLLGRPQIGVPIEQHAEVDRLRKEEGSAGGAKKPSAGAAMGAGQSDNERGLMGG